MDQIDRVEQRLREMNRTWSDLGRAINATEQRMYNWRTPDRRGFPRNVLPGVSDFISRSVDWILTGHEPISGRLNVKEVNQDYNASQGPDTRGLVPVISWVQAGAWHEAEDHYMPGDGEQFLPCPASHGLRSYALRVEGDSMTATHGKTYPDGCIIYVDPDQAGGVTNGDRVIAKFNGEAKVTFKVFVEEAGSRFLKPLNPQYPVITDEFRIIGKVIGKWEPE